MPHRTSPKEVFLHLLSIITLYFAAASFVTLLFQYVNILLPDALSSDYTYASYQGPLRFAVSSLIVVFPVLAAVMWFLNKGYVKEPARREMRLRKWLIYFTLFAAALIMIGDLVYLVYNFLGGEITARFVLKSLSLFLVVGAIFWHYLADIRRHEPMKSMKKLIWGVSVVVAAAVIGSFFLVGSPLTARARRFDDERVNGLQQIQRQVVNYWQTKRTFPTDLDALTNEIQGFRAPADPESGVAYEYRVLGALQFELCATFNLPSVPTARPLSAPAYEPRGAKPLEDFWDHGAGRTCFDRTIDPEFYPPFDLKTRPLPAQ